MIIVCTWPLGKYNTPNISNFMYWFFSSPNIHILHVTLVFSLIMQCKQNCSNQYNSNLINSFVFNTKWSHCLGAKFPFNDFASNAFDTEEPVKWGRKYSSEILFLKNISQRMYVTDVQQFGLQVLYDIDGKDYSIFVVEIRLYMFCTYLPAFAVLVYESEKPKEFWFLCLW